MKHSKFIAVIVVSFMLFTAVHPVFAASGAPLEHVEGRTWKEWGQDMKRSAEETPSSMTGDIDDVLRLTLWVIGSTVEYFADDKPEEKPQEKPKEEEKSSWWWPF